MPEKHARLSASGAARWIACPGSIALGEKFPVEDESEFAAEGTLAHSLAEAMLRYENEELTKLGYSRRLAELEKDPLYNAAMKDYVEVYTDTVIEKYNEQVAEYGEAALFIELQVDLSPWIPESFGTSDAVIVSPGGVYVFDQKFGKGIPVSARKNPQIMLYALGAIEAFHRQNVPVGDDVSMNIIQPRLDSQSTYRMKLADLEKWGDDLKPKARAAWNGTREYAAGTHCQFCPARELCKTRAHYATEVLELPADPALMTAEEIAALWPKIDQVRKWASHLTFYATKRAEAGVKFPGLKVIEGRSNRTVTDPEGLAESICFEYGEDARANLYRAPELKTITDLESLYGRKAFRELSKGFIHKPAGKPTLVVDDDPRPAALSAVDMFDEID